MMKKELKLDIKLVKVEDTQKSVLRQLIELYEYDFSEFDLKDVNDHGYYGYRFFDHYWTEESRHPFFIKVDGRLAGFVFVSDYCYKMEDSDARSISEFFVMRKYRRKGIGRTVARQIFDMFPGKWEVIQHEENPDSIIFWEGVIGEYTIGRFNKEVVLTEYWQGQALTFDNSDQTGSSQS